MTTESNEKDQRRVPDCPACGRLLGLYYAECQTCFAWAHVYTLADYEAMSIPPGKTTSDE